MVVQARAPAERAGDSAGDRPSVRRYPDREGMHAEEVPHGAEEQGQRDWRWGELQGEERQEEDQVNDLNVGTGNR